MSPVETYQATTQPWLDTEHLDRQTFGDQALKREVIGLFLAQIRSVGDRLDCVSPQELREMVHGLCGAARGLGAWQLAQLAKAVAHPDDAARMPATLDSLRHAMRETERLYARLV